MKIKTFNSENRPSQNEKQNIIHFLYKGLESYGDPKDQIEKAFDYSIKNIESFGGFTIALFDNDEIIGASIVNKTGMGGYIPENILVYIAVDKNQRGKGLGKKLMQLIIDTTEGDIALHVEANNPAKFLYEKVGFTNPYLEMRLQKK